MKDKDRLDRLKEYIDNRLNIVRPLESDSRELVMLREITDIIGHGKGFDVIMRKLGVLKVKRIRRRNNERNRV